MVGVVVSIYNVEKYLKECLDSVINQTYTNLEIILVNDGSTDENSLNIAKEYTLKDKRITLFDKKNGGQSTARNVGIEYFSGEYKLKNKTQTIKENSLIEFNIEGNNPYEIYTVYKSYKAFNNKQDLISFTYPIIDYIIFLDSDDYWELNCIEECVPRMDGVDVVWFDAKVKLDGIKESNWKSVFKFFNWSEELIIHRKIWLEKIIENNIFFFYWAWAGMINFDFLKNIKLKFINHIVQEDDHFGILLFSQMSYCYILPKEFYNYRIRKHSTMNYSNDYNLNSIPTFFRDNVEIFENIYQAKMYFHVSSNLITGRELINFINTLNCKILKTVLLEYLMPIYLKNAYEIIHFSKDPLKLFSSVEIIKNLMDKYGIKPHGVEFRFKNELPYSVGSIILENTKSFKKICQLPKKIFTTLKQNKINRKLFKTRALERPYAILPLLSQYEDVAKIDRLKEHLSYKIGLAFLKGHKYRYFGGYLVFLFNSLNLFLNYRKKTKKKQIKQLKYNSPIEKLEQRLSHMHWELTRSREILEQRLVNINYELHQLRLFEENKNDIFKEENILNISNVMNLLKIPDVIRHDFVNIFHKKSLFIDTTKDYLDTYNHLNKFDNIDIYAFEPNEVRFALIQKEKLKLFNFVLGKKNAIKRILPIGGLLKKEYILMPNFYNVANSSLVKVVDIVQFLENLGEISEYNFSILKLELNLQNIDVIIKIIEKELNLKFNYVIINTQHYFFKKVFCEKIQYTLNSKNINNIVYN
ncbi:glycosyltransferase, family 2 [Campylobacter lari]|nr:glycosyltransferase family 2 protein [Campylobacter lari]MCR6777248.1 glycosyltransferase [Campylobacter lari]